ncbi:hypothetical protein SDJN02_22837, partial [Cucurbita argyrosperma subsp. argyrosperma]
MDITKIKIVAKARRITQLFSSRKLQRRYTSRLSDYSKPCRFSRQVSKVFLLPRGRYLLT